MTQFIGDSRHIDVSIQDQDSPPFHYYLMREDKTDISLTSQAIVGSSFINVSSGHGFTPGSFISVMGDNTYTQTVVSGTIGNQIFLKNPIQYPFSIESTDVIRGSINMNVDGSSSNIDFIYYHRQNTVPIDIDSIAISIIHSSEGDDSKFGGIAELTNGISVKKESVLTQSLATYAKNSEFREYGAIVDYSDKAGGGKYSTFADFDLRKKYGIVIRIDPKIPEKIIATVRDDLTDLDEIKFAIMGQYTVGE